MILTYLDLCGILLSWQGGIIMQSVATIKGQIVIPAELRKKYGIKAGTKINVMDENDRIVLQPITREYIHSLRGKFRGKGLLKALADEKKKEKER